MWEFEVLMMVLSPFAIIVLIIIGLIAWRSPSSEKRKSIRGVLVLICIAPIAVVLLFKGIRYLDIPRNEKEYVRFQSPDSSLTLVVTTWTRFPMNEWLDPALSIRFRLTNTKTHRALGEARAHLIETSDLEDPQVEWNSKSVIITGFDNRRPGNNLVLEFDGK